MTIGNKNLLFTLEKISNDEEDELKDLSKNLNKIVG